MKKLYAIIYHHHAGVKNNHCPSKACWQRWERSCKLFLLTMLLCCSHNLALAQTDTCITNLKDAGTEYDAGNYDRAITLLTVTLQGCTLSKQDQVASIKLLLLSYLSIDDLEAAEAAAASIMDIDPNYEPDKFKDDPRLSTLFEKFIPEPTLAVSLSGGINFPEIDIEKTYAVVHADDAPGLASYQSNVGYQLGAEIQKRVYKNLWLALGFQFRNTNYTHTLDSVQHHAIHYTEDLTYFDFPLSFKYYFLSGSLKPYLQAGVDFSLLSRALSTTTRDEEKDLVDRTFMRNKAYAGYFGAAGLSYTLKSFSFFGNFRYTYFPGLVNKEGTRYADDINLYKYYYVDDDFRMDNLQVNIGIDYILYYSIKKVR